MGRIKVNKKKPPLSPIDKVIFYSILTGTFPFLLCWVYFVQYAIPHLIELASNTPYLATECSGVVSIPVLILCLLTFTIAGDFVKAKQPLFGNKNYKPKGLKPLYPVYPYFSKSYRENLTPKKRKWYYLKLIILFLIIVVCVITFLTNIFPRRTLDTHDSFISHNFLNLETDCAHISQAKHMAVKITQTGSARHGGNDYYLQMTIRFEDRSYTFFDRDFRNPSDKAILEKMIYLKSFFDEDSFSAKDLSYKEQLFRENNYTAVEKALFYELTGES